MDHSTEMHKHELYPSKNIQVGTNEVLVEVHGIVCSFCSKGIQNKLSKLPFVDTSKYIDGSKVDIDKQRVIVAIKSDKKANINSIYKAIKSGGDEPVSAYMLSRNKGIIKFNVQGKNEL